MSDHDAHPTESQRPVNVVLAGGGTAGHVSPLLAIAAAVRRAEPKIGRAHV